MKILTLYVLLLFSALQIVQAQDNPTIDHARRVRDSLIQEKFADVVAEFDARMTAALPVERLAQVWAGLKQQAGDYQSEISAEVATPQGYTAVSLGCRFERAELNMIVAFGADGKIAGLQFVPR